MIGKVDRSVVRNVAYARENVKNMERHNERRNQNYYNESVDTGHTAFNVHFKKCGEGYLQAFDRMIADGAISTRGLKKDAKIIDEMIFDVNTEYFERNGGYEFAKEFFNEAYKMAVREAGGEQYILSAVMHADEKNHALSEKLGHDVYHYHLHVVYIPVVDMEIKWTKRCKDPTLVGKVKEVVKQVSNSKKWKSERVKGEGGKERLVYSYSLLQDRYFSHMRKAGFRDFERGERGSTAEHLEVLDYKIKKDRDVVTALDRSIEKKRTAVTALDEAISGRKQTADDLGKKVEKEKKQLLELKERTSIARQNVITISKIESMGEKHTILGDIALAPNDWKTVSELAKEGIQSRGIISRLKEQIKNLVNEIAGLKKALQKYQGQSVTDTMRYYQAKQRAPNRMREVIAEIMRQPPEKNVPIDKMQERERKANQQEL